MRFQAVADVDSSLECCGVPEICAQAYSSRKSSISEQMRFELGDYELPAITRPFDFDPSRLPVEGGSYFEKVSSGPALRSHLSLLLIPIKILSPEKTVNE